MENADVSSLVELFEDVQMRGIFADSKTFVDSLPLTDLSSIQKAYSIQNDRPGFDLEAFVHHYFSIPEIYPAEYTGINRLPLEQHIETLWTELTRQPEPSKGSLIGLPYPYIVPGGRFREIYYWDSYFTMLGLQVSRQIDGIQNMTDNFTYLIDHTGYIPNGNRTYYLGRSQPPFYACMVNLLSEEKGENILLKYLPNLEKEYGFWMEGSDTLSLKKPSARRVVMLTHGHILNHYWDQNDTPRPESFKEDTELAMHVPDRHTIYRHLRAAAESGWDFSSRWFKHADDFSSIHTADIIPVDLNCLLHYLEKTLAKGYSLLSNKEASGEFESSAAKRATAINTYCWSDDKGFYVDYDHVAGHKKPCLTLAGVFPLYFGIASQKQAASVAHIIETAFLKYGGLITTLETTGQQWDAPNGWAPLQWMAIRGLSNYGYNDLARTIAGRWLAINEKVYDDTGKMMEKYNVVTADVEAGGGEYPAQDGFGWTNGVYLALKKWMSR